MTIQLGHYSGEKNKINKSVSFSKECTGQLRDEADVTNPAIMIEAPVSEVCGYNYAYIPAFKRWYFIQNCTSYRTSMTVIVMTVDVLFTYKEAILNSQSIITRSSKNPGDAVYSLPDNRYPVKQSETTHVIKFDTLYSNESDPTKGQTMILVLTGIDAPASP